jgi:signal transduction histidine kinase
MTDPQSASRGRGLPAREASDGPEPIAIEECSASWCDEREEAERTIRELRRQLADRDDFIATAGHELRNPMGAILLYVENLRLVARSAQSAPEWLHARLEALERHTRHFVRRATTLLDVSRLATGSLLLSREPVDLSAVVDEVAAEFVVEAERARCPMTLELALDVRGCWDRAAVETIAHNLLSNAIKYGAGRPISVRVEGDRQRASLIVRDHGIGIAREDHTRIFERFGRADASPDRPGFGVGLWIARQFAMAHGGDIVVESTLGNGSDFTASLPCEI